MLAILARDEPSMPPLKLQMLVVPAVDNRFTPTKGSYDTSIDPYPSHIECENVPCLPLNRMRWFSNLWIGIDPGTFNDARELFHAFGMGETLC